MNPKYSIIIPTAFDHLQKDLIPCIESIKKYTDLSLVEVIVVSNGCTDSTDNYIKTLGKPFTLISRPEALGYAKACNLGIEATSPSCEYIVFINNDCELLPQPKNLWLELLEEPFKKEKNIGVTGPVKVHHNEVNRDFLIFFCTMTKTETAKKLRLNEEYGMGYGEDIEFCIECENMGLKNVVVPTSTSMAKESEGNIVHTGNFPIHHNGGSTVKNLEGFQEVVNTNIKKLANKYNPAFYRPNILAFIPTKNRYDILPLAIQAVAFQTFPPKKLMIYDDGDHKDLREEPIYKSLFALLDEKAIKWEVIYGEGKGQHYGHQLANTSDFTFVWRCFTGLTKVETKEGLKNIKDIEIGELVKTHKNRFKKVLKTYKTKYNQNKDLLWIQTKNSTIKCTPNHPFLVNIDNIPKWIKAKNINKQDILLYPYENKKDTLFFNCYGRGRKIEQLGKKYLNEYFGEIIIDTDLARFFGLYLAEGCSGHDSIRFTFGNTEISYINFIKRICEEKFNRTPTIHKRWATTVKLNIRSFGKKFPEWFGKNAREKRIPSFVFNWNLKNKLAFINGYLEGDGWSNAGIFKFSSASKILIENMKLLLESCGLSCTEPRKIKAKINIGKSLIIKSNGAYECSINTQGTQKLYDLLGAKIKLDYLELPVENILKKKMSYFLNKDKQFVYNLEVEDDNSYIVGPIVVHNCDDDEVPEKDVLERLYAHMEEGVGAVGGAVIMPNQREIGGTNKIEDIFNTPNFQWSKGNEVKEVEHLYSSFLYKTGIVDYNLNLSPAAHREETLFTYAMFKAGYKLIADNSIITWHFRHPTGGIRTNHPPFFFENDEKIFLKILEDYGIKVISLNSGVGDHFAFLNLIPEFLSKYDKLIIGCCYNDVFKGIDKIKLVPIGTTENVTKENIYKYMQEHRWIKSLIEAYRAMYNL